MNRKVLGFIEKCEGWKTAIKALHWDSDSLSQHELCDGIADCISEFQDKVSEVEQSITGKLARGKFRAEPYKVKGLKKFVEDVLDATNEFYKSIESGGDTYVGMRSDCESFMSEMQRKLYLVQFTVKEDFKRRLSRMVNESMPKNPSNVDEFDKFMGRRPKSVKGRVNQIYRIVRKYGIDSRKYSDSGWQAIDDYVRVISSLGCEVNVKPCSNMNGSYDEVECDGGYTNYDQSDNMPRSKQYAVRVTFEDGMAVDGYISCMAAGTVEDPFSSYDTAIILWPKAVRTLASEGIRLRERDRRRIVSEAARSVIRKMRNGRR